MEILLTVGRTILVLLAVTIVAAELIEQRHNYGFVWSVWKRFRIRMLFECLGVLTLMIVVGAALWQIPGLKYGWYNLFSSKGGNILFGPILEGSESTSVLIRLIVPLFFIVLAFVLPFWSQREEKMFRRGYSKWSSIVRQSIKFGFIHCLVGVPLAFGFLLIIPGLFFGLKYKRAFERNVRNMVAIDYHRAMDEAVMSSTTYHTMYNMILVTIILLVTLVAV